VLRRCVWSRNIKNGCSIYIYDISRLRVNSLVFRLVCKLRKTAISLVMSVFSHGTTRLLLDGFSWSLIFEDFWKSVEKIPVWLKSDGNNCYFMWILLRMRNISDRSFRERQNTHLMFSNFLFRKPCR